MMKRIFKISLLAFSRKNRPFRITASLLFFVSFLLFSILSIIQIHQIKLRQSRGNIYGYFYSIVYQSFDEQSDESLISDIAVIRALPAELEGGSHVYVGTYNAEALSMMYRGESPFSAKELSNDSCLISRSLASLIDKKAGDKISVYGREFRIEAVAPDIGFFWIRGEREDAQNMGVPNIWLSDSVFSDLLKSNAERSYRMLLLDVDQATYPESIYTKGNIYDNTQIIRDLNVFSFRFPDKFFFFQKLALLSLVTILLGGYRHYAKGRYRRYSDLGLQDKQVFIIMILECLMIGILTLIIAIVAAASVCALYVNLAYNDISFFSLSTYFAILRPYFLVYLLGLCTSFIPPLELTNKDKFIYFRFKRSCIPIIGKRILLCSLPLLWLLVYMIVSFYTSVVNVRLSTRFVELFGQINNKYDYDIHYVKNSITPGYYRKDNSLEQIENEETSTYLFFYSDHKKKLDELAQKLESMVGVSSVERFYENHYGGLTVSDSVMQSDFISLVHSTSAIWPEPGPFTDKYIKKTESNLINCDLFMLPDHYLGELAGQMNVGQSQQNALLQGEACLLVSPSVRIKRIERDETGESVFWERTAEGENLTKDEELPNYKSLTVYIPQAYETLEGFVPQADLIADKARLKRITIPVAGSSYKNIAWFSDVDFSHKPYRILVSEKFFAKAKLDFETTRIRVFLNDQAKNEDVYATIASFVRSVPGLQITNQYYNMEVMREFKNMERLIFVMYIALFLVLLFAFAFSIGHMFCLANNKNFTLYRDLGMTVKKLLLRSTGNYLILLLIVCIAQVLINSLFWESQLSLIILSLTEIILLQLPVYILYGLVYTLIVYYQIRTLMRQQDYSL